MKYVRSPPIVNASDLYGKIILKLFLKKQNIRLSAGFRWLVIESNDGLY
jgi:hypothetical protein